MALQVAQLLWQGLSQFASGSTRYENLQLPATYETILLSSSKQRRGIETRFVCFPFFCVFFFSIWGKHTAEFLFLTFFWHDSKLTCCAVT